jgi:hypothetical protein
MGRPWAHGAAPACEPLLQLSNARSGVWLPCLAALRAAGWLLPPPQHLTAVGPEMMMQHADPLPCCCSIANVVLTATVDVCAVEQLVLQPIKTISGTVKLPGSKSLSNRILLLAALAEGTTVVKNLLVRSCVCALGGWSQRQLYMTLSIDAAFR